MPNEDSIQKSATQKSQKHHFKKKKQKKNTTSNCFCKDNHTETRKLLVYAAQN